MKRFHFRHDAHTRSHSPVYTIPRTNAGFPLWFQSSMRYALWLLKFHLTISDTWSLFCHALKRKLEAFERQQKSFAHINLAVARFWAPKRRLITCRRQFQVFETQIELVLFQQMGRTKMITTLAKMALNGIENHFKVIFEMQISYINHRMDSCPHVKRGSK